MIAVYKIECIPNGKVYIGSSLQVFGRLNTQFKQAEEGISNFADDYKKYGIENFSITILEICSAENHFDKERYYMAFYDCLNPEKGYNRQKLRKMGVK